MHIVRGVRIEEDSAIYIHDCYPDIVRALQPLTFMDIRGHATAVTGVKMFGSVCHGCYAKTDSKLRLSGGQLCLDAIRNQYCKCGDVCDGKRRDYAEIRDHVRVVKLFIAIKNHRFAKSAPTIDRALELASNKTSECFHV